MHSTSPHLLLASGSPRRRDLLALLGLPFVVQPSAADEQTLASESAFDMVLRLSRAKAQALLPRADGKLILAADTTVAFRGQVLGKPVDRQDAVLMLRQLRGHTHTVYSGITLLDSATGETRVQLVESRVVMRHYTDQEIAAYVATGDPLDKAGSYAIQYAQFRPVARISGCYANVMGLPLCHVYCLLRDLNLAPAETPQRSCDHFNHRRCRVARQILAAHCG
ncbi:MAG TPA: Maf family protein [Anaerolineae bacterium]|nr:Maf family protein [Anaerolineae bacterium]HNT05663.1 Maf family protein [Anaerolineae bacterium]